MKTSKIYDLFYQNRDTLLEMRDTDKDNLAGYVIGLLVVADLLDDYLALSEESAKQVLVGATNSNN